MKYDHTDKITVDNFSKEACATVELMLYLAKSDINKKIRESHD
jgi:hypothetical protein